MGQRGDRTGFDAIVAHYHIDDPAVLCLGDIIRAADKKTDSPEAAGLNAIVHGFYLMRLPDEETLRLEIPVFDALYVYCRQRVAAAR